MDKVTVFVMLMITIAALTGIALSETQPTPTTQSDCPPDDFSDYCVGCVDDCLEPMEDQTNAN